NNGGKVYKKPHYHVLYIARNPVTTESVRKKIKRALGSKSLSHIEIIDGIESVYK
ncbi:Rep family protein, partial [Staphylococcus hominis]